jgi:hypothetical protein
VTAAIIVLLMSVQTVTLAATPAEKVLVGLGRVRVVGMLALLEGVSNLAVSIALVSAYGAVGAALGTLFTSALLAPVKFPLVCRAAGCHLGRFLRDSVGVPLASAAPGVAAMVAVWLMLPVGAPRLALGLFCGLTLSLLVAAQQFGFRRALTTLRWTFIRRGTGANVRLDSEPAVKIARG